MLGSITGLAFGFASVVSKSSTVCSVSITAITVFLLLSLSEVQGGTPEVAGGESGNPATDEPWRKGLEDLGFTPSLEWDADVLIDARGGIKQAAVAGGLIRLALDIDGYQLTGSAILHDTELHIEGIYPYGADISTDVGALAAVNNNAAYNSPRLYEVWFQKGFQVGSVNGSLRIGLMGADKEFDVNDTAALFINGTFGAPLALGGTAPVPVYPFSALGVRLESSVGDDRGLKLTFRSGIYDGNSAAPEFGASSLGAPTSPSYNKYGIDFHLNPSIGLIILNELAFDFLSLQSGVPPSGAGRWFIGPGHVLIGCFYATNQFENIYQAQLQRSGFAEALKPLADLAGDYGVYSLWEQQFYQDVPNSSGGLYLFARGLVVPADRNFLTASAETGLVYKGVFRRQADLRDSIGVGFAYNSVSNYVRRADAVARQADVPEAPNLESGAVLEATYVLPITRHWRLQPDVQWITIPGATASSRNALVIGLRSILTF
jgi:porin